jgi:glycosyltransferase involved in cell wall biosynthesis
VAVIEEGSLILTVLNEAHVIQEFLDSLGEQIALPAEIVIVDGGSTDGTIDLLRNWDAPPGCAVKVLDRAGASISEGRNLAVANASYDRILVTDAGTTLDSEWAGRLLGAFDDDDAPDVVSGFFHPTGNTLIERAIAFTVTPHGSEIDHHSFLPSSRSLAFTREAWIRAGGYPEWLDFCEDLVFDLRLKKLGCKFTFIEEAWVTWSARPDIIAFMRQYYRYARGDGKANLWWKRHLVRYLAYFGGIALLVVSNSWPWVLLALAAGFFVYMRKFWGRLWLGRDSFGEGLAKGLALVPVVVIAGDVAKMIGYPVGAWWRLRRRNAVGNE